MSVGGIVTEVIVEEERVWINTADEGTHCAIFVNRDGSATQVKPDDIVWWQGDKAFWTTADKSIVERTLIKRGFSGVPRPD